MKRDVKVVGDPTPRQIGVGQFLDVFDTNIYKAKQLQEICTHLRQFPNEKYTVLFLDAWFPGIEMLTYIRDCAGVDLKIVGMLHAGCWDAHDFLSQKGCGNWAQHFENSVLKVCDRILLATEFHKKMIGYARGNVNFYPKVKIVDWPVKDPIDPYYIRFKQDTVVFPHRLAPEKRPEDFDEVRKIYESRYPNRPLSWIKTKDVCKTKDDYYGRLAIAKVAFSSAMQETFGIAMIEALHAYCVPVAPDRLSYVETLRGWPRYQTLSAAADLIYKAITNYENTEWLFQYNTDLAWLEGVLNELD